MKIPHRGRPTKGTGDWAMPATVRGQRSGCGAAYQSGGRPCLEEVPAQTSTIGGEPHLAADFRTPADRLAEAVSSTSGVAHPRYRHHRGAVVGRRHSRARYFSHGGSVETA